MGGIVVKKAYLLAREDPDLRSLAARVHSLYFLATPHLGSDLAKSLVNILKISFGTKPFVSEIKRNSMTIENVNDSFRNMAADLQLWSFYETIPTSLGITKAIIVDKNSATMGYPREKISLMNADHRSICKFEDKDDSNYQTLRNCLLTTVHNILDENDEGTLETPRALKPRKPLQKLFNFTEFPIEDISCLDEVRIPGSCEWLTSRDVYKTWCNTRPTGRRIFWLTGNAGAGKSILSSHVINHLQNHNHNVRYFFFKHGIVSKSTIPACLTAIAHQIAESEEMIFRRILEIQEANPTWPTWNERTIWQQVFLGCIFKEMHTEPEFWVIDALDECSRLTDIFGLLAQTPPHLRILITSRPALEIKKGFDKLEKLTESYQLQPEDTFHDLGIFIDSRMDYLPVGDDESRESLKSRILDKSCGSFLWVSLVVKELEGAYSEEVAEEIINEIPSDMNDVYTRMLESIPKVQRTVTVARSIFMWTLTTLRPLNIEELQSAIKLDLAQTVHNLAHTVSAVCGQLVYVNSIREVHIIHQTARTYLLEQDSLRPDLAIDIQQSNTYIAQMCLAILSGNPKDLQPWFNKSSASSLGPTKLVDYACVHFSDHLRKSSSEDPKTWGLLQRFLNSSVLLWIEYLARHGNIRSITRAAKNMLSYFKRRAKYILPCSPEKEFLESWVRDLIRFIAKFGKMVILSPSAIRTWAAALCPPESMIAKTYSTKQSRLIVLGLPAGSWDDCLDRVDYSPHQTDAIALGNAYSAVATSNWMIHVYYHDFVQAKWNLNHGEKVKILSLSSEDRYLASSGQHTVKVWDPREGCEVWTFNTQHASLTLVFIDEINGLMAATLGNYTVSWDLQEGDERAKWQWTDAIAKHTMNKSQHPQPMKTILSPNGAILALCYRGQPISLFDTCSERFVGSLSRTSTSTNANSHRSHYFVDVMIFKPCSETNLLIASYGDGELAIFDVDSAELRHCSPNVFAHSLACSPDGHTLVTGSSQGTMQIFEFSGIKGDELSLIYRINAYEDGIRGIAFSTDSLRFADIRRSQYRLWEPPVLVYSDLDEGSSSDISQTLSLEPRSVGMLEGPLKAEITAICYHPTIEIVFCGKHDGSIAYFDTTSATEKGVLHKHSASTSITAISILEHRSLLISADECGHVLIYAISVSNSSCALGNLVSEIHFDEPVVSLLPNDSGSKFLIRGRRIAEIWMTEGEKIGSSISLPTEDDRHHTSILNHPLAADCFMVVNHQKIQTYSWESSAEFQPAFDSPSPDLQDLSRIQSQQPTNISSLEDSNHFIVSVGVDKGPFRRRSITSVEVWTVCNTSSTVACPTGPLNIPGFNIHATKVRQLIGVYGSMILLLDADLWVCSLDLKKVSPVAHGAKRHFFLLPEWQGSDNGFIIDYVPSRKEFLVARQDSLLVLKRGLEFGEPWHDA